MDSLRLLVITLLFWLLLSGTQSSESCEDKNESSTKSVSSFHFRWSFLIDWKQESQQAQHSGFNLTLCSSSNLQSSSSRLKTCWWLWQCLLSRDKPTWQRLKEHSKSTKDSLECIAWKEKRKKTPPWLSLIMNECLVFVLSLFNLQYSVSYRVLNFVQICIFVFNSINWVKFEGYFPLWMFFLIEDFYWFFDDAIIKNTSKHSFW